MQALFYHLGPDDAHIGGLTAIMSDLIEELATVTEAAVVPIANGAACRRKTMGYLAERR